MKFNLLEPITYSKNSNYPQFTIFNYIMDRNSYIMTPDINAIFLSQLPVIFKKYNIPLYKNDLFFWLNSKYNIADIFDVQDIINCYDNATKDEKKEIDFIKEVLDFFSKINANRNNKDKLIEELINKRYNYYYNRYDKYAYYKFITFLNLSIEDGFIPYQEVDINQDFTMNKKERIEQQIRDYFYSIKLVFKDKTIVFLSERFQKVYEALVNKYPEIKISSYFSSNEYQEFNRRMNAVFINDINYELIPNMKIKYYVPHLNFAPIKYHQLPQRFIPNDLQIHRVIPPYLKTDVSLREQIRINDGSKFMRCRSIDNITEVIDYLESEREILIENGVSSTLHLLPNAFQEYFSFCIENEPFITYFKNQINTNVLTPEIKKKALKNLLNDFDISVIPNEIIEFFSTIGKDSPILKHVSMKEEPIAIKNKVNFIRGIANKNIK